MKKYYLLFVYLLVLLHNAKAQNVALSYYNSYTPINKPILSGGASFTIEFWIKTTLYPDNLFGLYPYTVVDIGNTNYDTNRFRLTCAKNNQLQFQLDDNNIFRSNSMVADISWHHVAFVYDSAATKQYSVYVDGNLDTNLTGPRLDISNNNSFRLGADVGGYNNLEGALDEFRIFDHVRTDSAINADMNREYCDVSGKGLLVYFKFNDGWPSQDNRNLKVLSDFSGNGNHLSYNGFSLRGSCSGFCSNFVFGPSLTGGNTRDTITLYDCDTVFAPSKLRYWTVTGKYFDTLENVYGCDSILLLNVKIGNITTTKNIISCDSFITPLGKVIKNDSIIYETYRSYMNCDSTVFYDIKLNRSSKHIVEVETCDSFVSSSGKSYYFSGTYDEHFTNWKGCDSTVQYRLTINNDVNTFEYLQACDFGEIRGEWFNSSAVKSFHFISNKGCDSTHYVFLTVNRSNASSIKVNACDSFVSPQGNRYFQSGAFTEKLVNWKGCDSLVTYNLTLGKSKIGKDTMSVCNGVWIQGKWHDTSGTVRYLGKSYLGCDSTVEIWLTVKKSDLSIEKIGNTLQAGQDSAIYQWISCSNFGIIPFESKQIFTPSIDGDYAVIVIYKGCQDTTPCTSFRYSGLNELSSKIGGKLFPNPGNGNFKLELNSPVNSELMIYDASGRLLKVYRIDGDVAEIETDLDSGIYLLMLGNGTQGAWILVVE